MSAGPPGRQALLTDLALGAALVAAVAAIYAQTAHHDFVSFDDGSYVTENPHVRSGLSRANLRWAFGAFHSGNWHPLTWISHQLDVELFGLAPGRHHLVNAALHALNSVLLFAFLRLATASLWAGALVALLFAVHPQRVESVAWISERKDLLAGGFFFLTLIAYARYARAPSAGKLAGVAGTLALGLMAKPMLVSVPLVLLALDAWPLRRPLERRSRAGWAEKLPLFALALASCVVTVFAQRAGGAVRSLEDLGLAERLGTAVLGFGAYLVKAFVPTGLAFFYPHPALVDPDGLASRAAGLVAGVVALLVVTASAWRLRRRAPAVLTGWIWFVVMLLPVIGLVQVGTQLYADRYVYLPQVGLTLAVVYGLGAFLPASVRRSGFALALLWAGALAFLAERQAETWKDDRSLCEHALAVTERNALAHAHLGLAYQRAHEFERAREQHLAALAIAPRSADALSNLAALSLELGKPAEARRWLDEALRAQPSFLQARLNLGLVHERENDPAGALAHYERAAGEHPDSPEAHGRMGDVLLALGRPGEARASFARQLELDASATSAWCGLGEALGELGSPHEALASFARARELEPASPRAAVGEAWIRATSAAAELRDPARALQQLEALDGTREAASWRVARVRAAALAAAGRFDEAVLAAAEASARAPRSEWERLGRERETYAAGRALER